MVDLVSHGVKRTLMNNEQIIRTAYELAEKVDVKGWTQCFTPDGTFTDMSIGVTYRGPDGPTGLGKTVEVYAKAFPDMHRELYRFFSIGDVVVVELALQGTHRGPLPTPMGILPATGKRMDAPCCDVFRIVNGKIQSFNCYPSGTVIFAQLGVLSNIEAAIAASSTTRARLKESPHESCQGVGIRRAVGVRRCPDADDRARRDLGEDQEHRRQSSGPC